MFPYMDLYICIDDKLYCLDIQHLLNIQGDNLVDFLGILGGKSKQQDRYSLDIANLVHKEKVGKDLLEVFQEEFVEQKYILKMDHLDSC